MSEDCLMPQLYSIHLSKFLYCRDNKNSRFSLKQNLWIPLLHYLQQSFNSLTKLLSKRAQMLRETLSKGNLFHFSFMEAFNPLTPRSNLQFSLLSKFNSYNVSSENLVLDQLIIPKLIFFFVLIINLVDIVLILYRETLPWSLMGVKGLRARDLWVPVDSIEITASLPRHGTQFSRLTKYVSLLTGQFGAKRCLDICVQPLCYEKWTIFHKWSSRKNVSFKVTRNVQGQIDKTFSCQVEATVFTISFE